MWLVSVKCDEWLVSVKCFEWANAVEVAIQRFRSIDCVCVCWSLMDLVDWLLRLFVDEFLLITNLNVNDGARGYYAQGDGIL